MEILIELLFILLGTAALLGALVLSVRAKAPSGHLFLIKDTASIALMAVLCLGLGYLLPVFKIMDPTVGGEGPESYWFTGVCGGLLLVLAAYLFLYGFVRRTVVYSDRIEQFDSLGRCTRYAFSDIESIEQQALQKSTRLVLRDKKSFSVSNARKDYAKLIEFLRQKMQAQRSANLVADVEKNLSGL